MAKSKVTRHNNSKKIMAKVKLAQEEIEIEGAKWLLDTIQYMADMQGIRDTGYYINDSWSIRRSENGWSVGTRATYWSYLEYGTKYMQARPHITPAIERVQKDKNTMAAKIWARHVQ